MPLSEGGETLFERLVGFENLYRAAGEARRGKRYKAAMAQFHQNLAENLVELQDELLGGRYRPGPYYTFTIFEPSRRIRNNLPPRRLDTR